MTKSARFNQNNHTRFGTSLSYIKRCVIEKESSIPDPMKNAATPGNPGGAADVAGNVGSIENFRN